MVPAQKDGYLPTRRSLLSRLRNWDDRESWRDFYDTYGRLIYHTALKAGLSPEESQDVVQDTILVVARKMPGFKYDPAIGSFKGWLRQITRRRIDKQLRKRLPGAAASTAPRGLEESRRTATLDRIPDPAGGGFEQQWEADWEQSLRTAALERVKRQIKPKQFQIFDLHVLREWPVEEVASALNVSAVAVYVCKHRVGALLRKELAQLRQKSQNGG